MGRFARDAPWIRRIFTPSGTPATRQPSAVSEDVQLTQSYLAHGQTQAAEVWIHEETFNNPGQGNAKTVLNPLAFAGGLEEVWRVFFLSIQIPAGPAANYTFDVRLVMPATGREVLISQKHRIVLGNVDPINIYPQARYDSTFATTVSSSPTPLLLPASEDNAVLVQIVQGGSQAVDTIAMESQAYILRNPRGLAHLL